MYRIIEKSKGWIVEIQVCKWTFFGIRKVWKPFVKTLGMDCVWHHSSRKYAEMNLQTEIKLTQILDK